MCIRDRTDNAVGGGQSPADQHPIVSSIRKGDVVRISRQQPAQPHQRRARRTRPALLLVLAPAVVVTPAAAAAIGTHASTPSLSPAVSAAQFSGPSVTSTSTTAQPASSAYTVRIPDTGESGAGDDDASDAPDRTLSLI